MSVPTIATKNYPTRWNTEGKVKLLVDGSERTTLSGDGGVKSANATAESIAHGKKFSEIVIVGEEGKDAGRVVRRIFRPAEKPVVPSSASLYSV